MTKQWGYVNVDKTAKPIVDAWVKVNGALKGRTMWFEKQLGEWVEVLTVNKPSIPLSITVPTVAHMKENIIVSWGASKGAIRYHLEQSIDGGSFEEVYQGTNRTFTDTAELGWETSRYRVRAYNNAGYSDYRTSSVVNISGVRIPKGTIVAWSGTADTIPSGWYLCDGNNGTPNLIDRFVMGGTSSGATGGGSHVHTLTNAGIHTHTVNNGGNHRHTSYYNHYTFDLSWSSGSTRRWYTDYQGEHAHSLSTDGEHSHTVTEVTIEPLHYKLAFIMKG